MPHPRKQEMSELLFRLSIVTQEAARYPLAGKQSVATITLNGQGGVSSLLSSSITMLIRYKALGNSTLVKYILII